MQDHELVAASMVGDVVRVASLLNSGADVETKMVCYIASMVVCSSIEFTVVMHYSS